MAFKFEVKGMDELLQRMDRAPKKAAKVGAEALFEGAGVIADSVSGAVHGIRTAPFKYAKNGEKRLPSPEEKAIVESSRHGIAKFQNSGVRIQTSVGFQNSGYAAIGWNHARAKNSRTLYKQGEGGRMVHASQGAGASQKPVPLIVNSINSGTSFMQKQPFLRRAFSKSKGAAAAAIEAWVKEHDDELDLG